MWALVLGACLIACLCVIVFVHGASTRGAGSRTMLDIDRVNDRPEHRDAA